MNPILALLLLAVASIIWGSSHAVGKLAIAQFDPLLLAALRVVIASGCFWGLRFTGIAPADRTR